MSEVKWTNEQLNAITKKDSNILVAAAARKWKDSCISRANYKKNNRPSKTGNTFKQSKYFYYTLILFRRNKKQFL